MSNTKNPFMVWNEQNSDSFGNHVRIQRIKRWLFVVAIMAVSIGAAFFSHLKQARERDRCQSKLRSLYTAFRLTVPIPGERSPRSLQSFFSSAPERGLYVCPASGHQPGDANEVDLWTDYAYVSGLDEGRESPRCVLAFCPPQNHEGQGANILFFDGTMLWYPAEAFKNLTNNPSLFFGTTNTSDLDKLRSRTKILYPKRYQ